MCYDIGMNTLETWSSENTLPTDINMVGGTMPWLMFYAGFMQGLFNEWSGVALNKIKSISGTSAGAFIAAMTAVWHHQALLDIILNTFWDDTGKEIPWLWRVWILGKKTIQVDFKAILDEYITAEKFETDWTPTVKTLHMEMEQWPLFKKTENWRNREIIWLFQAILKDQFFKLWDSVNKTQKEYYWEYKIFDSSLITKETRDNVAGLIAASWQYSPVLDPKIWKMRIDGEFWSWHESSDTSVRLLEGVWQDSNVLILTRHPKGSKGYNAVVTQSAKMQGNVRIVAPDEALRGWIVNTNPENMKHNFAVGQRAAEIYLQVLAA